MGWTSPVSSPAAPSPAGARPPAGYSVLCLLVLALACFNVTFRLGHESVGEWDEALYATTAWEMLRSGALVGTTFNGALDYYNSKPPLNVWIIAASFWAFGVNLVSLRVAGALFGCLTVWLLMRWTRPRFGAAVSLLSGLVLASSFAFVHQHSARSGNPDALLTLLILLVVMVLSAAAAHPWRFVWLGPLCAAVFLLKGMAVLLPLLLIGGVEAIARPRVGPRGLPYAATAAAFVLIVGGWALARWQVDGSAFFRQMLANDLIGVSIARLDGHRGSWLFYADVLQRYHYEWLLAGAVGVWLARAEWRSWAGAIAGYLRRRDMLVVLPIAWGVVTVMVPTAMQTRLFWYLNPFYPLFAILVALALTRAMQRQSVLRRTAVALTVAGALVVAESKMLWRLYEVTNLDDSVQGLLLLHLRGDGTERVYRDRVVHSERFVVQALRSASFEVIEAPDRLPHDAASGDLVVIHSDADGKGLHRLGAADGYSVYRVP